MGSETAIERYDPGPNVLRNTLWNGMPAAEIPCTIPIEQTQLLCRANMDRVQFVGVFMPKLASHQSPDIASTSGVLFVAKDGCHKGVPEIGNLPEIHVRVVWQGRREAETGK